MAYPIVTPQAFRISTTFAAPIDASLGGSIKATDMRTSALVININGDCGFVWAFGANVAMLRVKTNGQFCWYANCNFSAFRQVLQQSIINIVNFIGNNAVQVWSFNGATNYSTVIPFPTNFVNGGWVNFSAVPFNAPPCPCGGAQPAHTTYYDAKNNLMLTEYIKSFSNDYQLWASVFRPGQSGPVVLNQGYMGFFDNSTNPVLNSSGFNHVSGGVQYSPTRDTSFSYDQNGNFIGRHIFFTDDVGAFVAIGASSITPGNLDCSGLATNYPQVNLTLNQVLNMNDPVFNGYTFHTSQGSLGASATDIENCVCIFNNFALNLFNTQNFVELWLHNSGEGLQYGSGFFNNNVISVCSRYNGATPPYNVSIYFATPDAQLPPLTPPPVIQSQQAASILNWHRPISTRGLFKT